MSAAMTRGRGNVTGRRLRELRVNRGLSPEQLGEIVGVSGRTVRRIEGGNRPTPAIALKIAQHFEVEPTDLWPLERAA